MTKFNFKDIEKSTNELKMEYMNAVQNGEDPEVIDAKHADYMNAFAKDQSDAILAQARAERDDVLDKQVLTARGMNVLTAEEEKFFMNLVEDEADLDTYKEKALLPETVIERVFDDIKKERPLLAQVKFQTAGLKVRMIYGDPEGQAVWGEIFGKIQGQISANFRDVSFYQNKLTAFAIVPKDLKEFGPQWIERLVRMQLAEAVGAKLEEGIVLGRGQTYNEPIGIMKEVTRNSETGVMTTTGADKEDIGQVTFADDKTTVKELTALVAALSVKENGNPYTALNKTSIIVHPADAPFLLAANTVRTLNGDWATSLPFNATVITSEFVPQGKGIAAALERYQAAYTGAVDINEYKETLALEDVNVYIAKQFAHGEPEDNNVSVVFDLAVPKLEEIFVPEA